MLPFARVSIIGLGLIGLLDLFGFRFGFVQFGITGQSRNLFCWRQVFRSLPGQDGFLDSQ